MKLILVAVIVVPVIVIASVLVALNLKPPQCSGGPANVITGPTIFNHNCTDISQIPAQWIDQVQQTVKFHYAHRSHGEQLTVGLDLIESENITFNVARDYFTLPAEAGALCILDGPRGYHGDNDSDYVYPWYYWADNGLNRTRDILNSNPTLNFSMWTWCTELDDWDESQVQGYLDNMSLLEAEYPNVTFIYMTGNAQADGWAGYNRYLRNQQIREYCKNNSKYLFDFEDIDSWYNGEQCTYVYEGVNVPHQHPHFYNPDGPGHTIDESCQLKGDVVWWMFARILGWAGPP